MGWAMQPFEKQRKPVLIPTSDSIFRCPVVGQTVRWEDQNVYNPAAVVRDGLVHILYRADDTPRPEGWGRTCRIGLATSEDGRNFTRHPEPVLYPDNDPWKIVEWEGGCEDLHIIEREDDLYVMNYTTWDGHQDTMSIATSTDLIHWTKHGPAFHKYAPNHVYGSRSGVVLSRLEGDRLIAARFNGRYLMFYTHRCWLAASDDLIDWRPLGTALFDQGGEAGAIALLREDGILLMENSQRPPDGAWSLGQALIDARDPTRVLDRLEPFLLPEFDWEHKGSLPIPPTVVANGLIHFRDEWLLYYGAADHVIGLAVYDGRGSEST